MTTSGRPAKSRLALFAVLAIAVGCGEALPTVSGQLTLDGQPLSASDTVRVTIMFYPESDGAPAAALADHRGWYELATGATQGIAPGRYVAVVSAVDSSSGTDGTPQKRVITPEIYADPTRSGLVAEVKPGSNRFDFDLKSNP